jgi:hypothetical protein
LSTSTDSDEVPVGYGIRHFKKRRHGDDRPAVLPWQAYRQGIVENTRSPSVGPCRATRSEAIDDAWRDFSNGHDLRAIVKEVESLPERARRRITQTLSKREGFPKRVRDAIIARDETCVLGLPGCGGRAFLDAGGTLHADHIDPDGSNTVENGRAVCPNCHDLRHNA